MRKDAEKFGGSSGSHVPKTRIRALYALILVAIIAFVWMAVSLTDRPGQRDVVWPIATAERPQVVVETASVPVRIRISAEEAGPLAGQVWLVVRDGGVNPVAGAESFIARRHDRLRRKSDPVLAYSDDGGVMKIDTERIAGADVIGVAHKDYSSSAILARDLIPGEVYRVDLARSYQYEIMFRSPKGDPVEGVGFLLSKSAVYTADLSVALSDFMPGCNENSAVYYGVSGKDGRARLHGLAPGGYLHDVRSDVRYPIYGMHEDWARIFSVPQEAVAEVTMLELYAAVVYYDGDEVLASSASVDADGLSVHRWQTQLESWKEKLQVRFPGAFVWICVPSLKLQRGDSPIGVDLRYYGASSGWGVDKINLVPLLEVEPQRVSLPSGSVDLAAQALCQIRSPCDRKLQTSVVSVLSVDGGRSPSVHKLLPLDGGVVRLPVGDYRLFASSPFLRLPIGDGIVSLRPGVLTQVQVDTEFDLVEVEPHVVMPSGERPTLVHFVFTDVASRIEHRLETFSVGRRILLPANRPLACEVWIPGIGSRHITTKIDRATELTGVIKWDLRIPE